MHIELATAWVMLIALVVYTLLGGADFGGGVWDFFAAGPRKAAQRRLIVHAIGPIWEANHVWLILIVVLMFSGFPRAFGAMMTALHIPVTLMLIGVVLRGSAFTFHVYAVSDARRRRWARIFSMSSVVTPLLLGVVLAATASGRLRWDAAGVYTSGFITPWLASPFCWSTGLFTLAIFAFLAAVYLCVEARDDRALQDDFRRRALIAGVAVGVTAGLTWILARSEAMLVSHSLAHRAWSMPLQITTGAVAIAALLALWRRAFGAARVFAGAQVAMIITGYGLATFPYLVVPQFTIENSAAPARTHELLLASLAAGSVILLPSFWWLYRVFKGRDVRALGRPEGADEPGAAS